MRLHLKLIFLDNFTLSPFFGRCDKLADNYETNFSVKFPNEEK